jgi:hypothetical protein
MDNNKKAENKSRRSFLSLLLSGKSEGSSTLDHVKRETVKMLTADGKVVEVEKSILDKATNNQKATNKEIYQWMRNPSKENNS